MKKLILTTLILFSFNSMFAQQISPSNEDEYCPETFYNFIIYVSGDATSPKPTLTSKNSLNYYFNPNDVTANYSGGITTVNFKVKFADINNIQTIVFNYQVSGQAAATKEFDFKSIKSLLLGDPRTSPYPVPSSINAERCKSQTWSISFPNTQYINVGLPAIEQKLFGSVTQYEYSLPQGWSLNGGTPVTGPSDTRIGSNNVTITSDFAHGDGLAIYIRPLNSCNTALAKNNYGVIKISRPAPVLTISGSPTICSGSSTYTINGLTNGATTTWSSSSLVSISPTVSPYSNPTTAVTKIGDNFDAVLTATVTDCIETYKPVTKIITLGKPIVLDNAPWPFISDGGEVVQVLNPFSDPAAIYKSCAGNFVRSNMYTPNTSTTTWQFLSGTGGAFSALFGTLGKDLYYHFTTTTQTALIKYTIANACGYSTANFKFLAKACSKFTPCTYFRVAPSVITNNSISVSPVLARAVPCLGVLNLANARSIQSITVYDPKGEVVATATEEEVAQGEVSLSGLPVGNYTIKTTTTLDEEEIHPFIYSPTVNDEKNIAEQIASGTLVINKSKADLRLYVMQQQLYETLQTNDAMVQSSSILQDFALKNGGSGLDFMYQIGRFLDNAKIEEAQKFMEVFKPQNEVEESYKNFYALYISYIQSNNLNSEETNSLLGIASKCPFIYGNIIYSAQNLYNNLTQEPLDFSSNCDNYSSRGTTSKPPRKTSKLITHNTKLSAITIFPNPAKDNFSIKFPATTKGLNTIKVVDMFGKTLLQKNTIGGTQNININQTLAKGIYTVQITNSATGKTETQKLIIQ